MLSLFGLQNMGNYLEPDADCNISLTVIAHLLPFDYHMTNQSVHSATGLGQFTHQLRIVNAWVTVLLESDSAFSKSSKSRISVSRFI